MLTSNHIERDKSALNTNQTLGTKTARALQMLDVGLSVWSAVWADLWFLFFPYDNSTLTQELGTKKKKSDTLTHSLANFSDDWGQK